jgi:E3 SUMO-protein ligase PIAS1
VTIEPNGKWSYSGVPNGNSGSNGIKHEYDEDDSDDLVEVTEVERPSFKHESPATPFSFSLATQVPSPASAASVPRAGQKRKSEVIDLTLSDDEAPPAAKRPAYDTPNSLPDRRNGYPSFRTSSSHALSTNGNASHQLGRSSFSGLNNPFNLSSPPHRSAMAGSPLAPIPIPSPPAGLSSVLPPPHDYSGHSTLSFQQRQHQSSHHLPPPPSQNSSSNSSNPTQRATLLELAHPHRSFGS